MKTLPSKELLSEVLGVNVKTIYHINSNPNLEEFDLPYSINGSGDLLSINIYELVHKCKEWAFDKGYIVSSGLIPVLGVNKDGWAEVFSSLTPLDGKLHTFKQLSEPEAVFKALKWIMEQTK